MKWKALNREEINSRVDEALAQNVNYSSDKVIGIPGTYLDQKEFYPNAPFLKKAPFLKTLIANPNHIGCHTLKHQSSPIFKGTQSIEKDLIDLCAEDIFQAAPSSIDGYVATGGTEANIEAMWIYRNYYMQEYNANSEQIGVLFSEDTHYSITKGCNLLQLKPFMVPVNRIDRTMENKDIEECMAEAEKQGIKYFIVILNLSTTLFGSVDPIEPVVDVLEAKKFVFKIHVDAAFGGFIYPFTNPNSEHHFSNRNISSVSIDAHKMLQTPYGTGVFLIRKGYLQYVTNESAQYVPGLDYTLCGSRSGANAIAIWMLLMNYGFDAWSQKMNELLDRTDFLCQQLDKLGIHYYRNPFINIVTIKSNQISPTLALKYELVADTYEHKPSWWKIVVMDHVNYSLINDFLNDLGQSLLVETA